MPVRGFWQAALADPARPALIEASGRTLSAEELAGASHQLVHALRARGLARGDVVAMLLPNAAPALEVLLAAMQGGWYITPLNTNLAPPEIAHILRDSGAKAFVADAREAERAVRAADEAELPASARIAVGELPGFASYQALKRAQPTTLPPDRCAGQFMQYTSGTTGKPKGIKRDLIPMDPDAMAGLQAGHLGRFGITPGEGGVHLCTSPMYHTAPLAFNWFSLHFEHTVVLMDRWDPERALEAIQQHRVTTTHMVPTQFHRLLLLPEATRRRYDCSSLKSVLHAAAPCPVEVKRRMLEWWGPVIYEYYGATEGGGTLVTPQEWLERPGTVGKAWEGAAIRVLDDEGKDCPARPARNGVPQAAPGLRLQGRRAEDPREPPGQFLHRGRRRVSRRGRLPVPVRPQDRHDHLGRRQHLPRGDRGRAPLAPEGGRRRGLRDPGRRLGRAGEGGDRARAGRGSRRGAGGRDPGLLRGRGSRSTSARARSTSPMRCREIPTASSTSASCATPTGRDASGGSEPLLEPRRARFEVQDDPAESRPRQLRAGEGLAVRRRAPAARPVPAADHLGVALDRALRARAPAEVQHGQVVQVARKSGL